MSPKDSNPITHPINKTALVTGGNRGIGRGIALALSQAGYAVAVNYRKGHEAACSLIEEIEGSGGHAFTVQAHFPEDRIRIDPGFGVERVIGRPLFELPSEDGDQTRDGVAARTQKMRQQVLAHLLCPGAGGRSACL